MDMCTAFSSEIPSHTLTAPTLSCGVLVWTRLATGHYVTAEKDSAADVCFVKTLLVADLILTMSKSSHNYVTPREGQWEGECTRGR